MRGHVFWFMVAHLATSLVDLFAARRAKVRDEDVPILVPRHQVRLPQRRQPRPPRLTRGEKLTLAVLTAALVRLTAGPEHQLDRYVLPCKPDTILTWPRDLVRRKWTFRRRNPGGRAGIPAEVAAPILRLARGNPRWDHCRIRGEPAKLGHTVSRSMVRAVLRRRRVPPAPQRRATTWRDVIRRHRDTPLACDFFTVETAFLGTVHVLSSLAVGTRRVPLAGCTGHPTAAGPAGWP